MKEKIIFIFLFLIAFTLGSKVIVSELYFLSKLFLGLIIIGLILIISYLLLQQSKTVTSIRKRLLFFLIYSIFLTIFINYFGFFKQDTLGLIFFLYYLGLLTCLPAGKFLINCLVSLLAFCFIPFFNLDNLNYYTEIAAVFGFLTLIITSIQFILISLQNANDI